MPLLLLTLVATPELAALALLAAIQGLTEFLPISSSGHLVLAQSILGLSEPGLTIDIVLHLGTLAAVLVIYRRDVFTLSRGLLHGDWREPLLVAVGTLPIVYVGLVHGDRIEALFHSPRFAAKALIGTAAILLVGEWARRARRPAIDPISDASVEADAEASFGSRALPTWWGALAIGLAQSLAVLPGISRSGTTIAAGFLVGLAPQAAARFSFLLAIPAILGAAVHQLPDALAVGLGVSPVRLLLAALVAALVGWAALRLLLAFLGRGVFVWFALYCAALGGGYLLST